MEWVESAGTNVDEAVERALLQLGISRDAAEIEVLENPTRGLLGLVGGRPARVRVRPNVTVSTVDSSDGPAPSDATTNRENQETRAMSDKSLESRAVELLSGIIERIGIEATVQPQSHPEGLLLELVGDTSGILIGRHGQMLDALEYVVNRSLLRDDEGAFRVIVDSNNYRSRHRASLEDLALRMAQQATRKRVAIALNPMPPQDRRIVHLTLQNQPGLTTQSSGSGVLRRLVIIPDGVTVNPADHE